MAVRTTSDNVKGVLRLGSEGGDYDDVANPSLTPYIATANAITSRVYTCSVQKKLTLSTTELELIERWLAAHFYAMSDQTYAQRSTQGASGSFQGQTGMGLEATKYGQTALAVDYSGCLTAINKRQFASGFWLGKPASQQLDWEDRN